MTDGPKPEIDFRESLPGDIPSLEELYPAAFPDEDLLPLVSDLLRESDAVLSLVAIVGGALAGSIMFTTCGVEGRTETVALLAPLCVAPDLQKRGVGGALIREGLRRAKTSDATHILVLGDPNYYARFGFETETGVAPPYPLPDEWREAWRSITIRDVERPLRGKLQPPELWLRPELWGP